METSPRSEGSYAVIQPPKVEKHLSLKVMKSLFACSSNFCFVFASKLPFDSLSCLTAFSCAIFWFSIRRVNSEEAEFHFSMFLKTSKFWNHKNLPCLFSHQCV